MVHATDQPECWPALPLDSWKETYTTLHMWTQIVGKVRLRLTPLVNHWWNVPLYVTARGLTTTRIPYGKRAFEVWFDRHPPDFGFNFGRPKQFHELRVELGD